MLAHTTIGCEKQGFPSAQPYLSHMLSAVNHHFCPFLVIALRMMTGVSTSRVQVIEVMPFKVEGEC